MGRKGSGRLAIGPRYKNELPIRRCADVVAGQATYFFQTKQVWHNRTGCPAARISFPSQPNAEP